MQCARFRKLHCGPKLRNFSPDFKKKYPYVQEIETIRRATVVLGDFLAPICLVHIFGCGATLAPKGLGPQNIRNVGSLGKHNGLIAIS